jgi:hypothetical protein
MLDQYNQGLEISGAIIQNNGAVESDGGQGS